jgi:hypothetical protein
VEKGVPDSDAVARKNDNVVTIRLRYRLFIDRRGLLVRLLRDV